jgi:CRP-like cAMP-binding protein
MRLPVLFGNKPLRHSVQFSLSGAMDLAIFSSRKSTWPLQIVMSELLYQNIEKRGIVLSEEEQACIQALFTYRKFRKGQYILQQGDVSRHETFVLKGMTRTYETNEQGQEHVLFFGPEDWWVGDMYSFLKGTPSNYNIDCLEETEVLQITKPNLELLYEKVPQCNKYFRILLQQAFIANTQRIGATMTQSALQRYQEFQVKYPSIENRIPNHQVASFLGITPQSLSRVRRQITGK